MVVEVLGVEVAVGTSVGVGNGGVLAAGVWVGITATAVATPAVTVAGRFGVAVGIVVGVGSGVGVGIAATAVATLAATVAGRFGVAVGIVAAIAGVVLPGGSDGSAPPLQAAKSKDNRISARKVGEGGQKSAHFALSCFLY